MKNNVIFSLLLLVICIFAILSGCTETSHTETSHKNSSELNETTEEESRQIADAYVRGLNSYKIRNLTEPVLIETRDLNCSSCWQFIYKFDLVSQKDPAIVDTATVTVTIVKGEIVDTVYAQGSRY